jgi:hypothetical protein
MFTSIVLLIFLLPAAFLPLVLGTLFSSRELSDMGIFMEQPNTPEPPAPRNLTKAANSPQTCHSCMSASLSI